MNHLLLAEDLALWVDKLLLLADVGAEDAGSEGAEAKADTTGIST